MQYKVPQNVDIEDQVIGPLSLRQFVIFLVAVGIILVFHFTFQGPLRIIFWFLALLVAGLAALLAFAKYGDQNSEIFLASAFKTILSPRKRIWRKEDFINETPAAQQPVEQTQLVTAAPKSLNEMHDDLNRLAELVDSGAVANLDPKDRGIGFAIAKTEDKETPDLLEQAERPNVEIDTFLAKAGGAEKREPLISEVASLSPDQYFDYEKIEVKKRPQ